MSDHRPAFNNHTAPPIYRVALADRHGLLEKLRAADDRRVVLLDAPAGYGKTWLLGRWYAELRASGTKVAWLGVEQADAPQFLTLVVAGLARAGIDVGRLEGLADQGFTDVPVVAAVGAITAALAHDEAPLVIFVDDMHRLPRDVVQDVLARLVADAPPNVRFACSGRDCSALPRGAMRARGDLLEIDTDSLRFGVDEARALFPRFEQGQIESLLERTEGWPVALQLARLWLEAKPGRSNLLDAFSGHTHEVAEYLTEQVLSDLPQPLQQTLDQVSILDQVNPELVAAVTCSDDAWRRLLAEGRLEHFLVPLDQERYWFRLHHLLLDYLRDRGRDRADDVRELHGRAATWFEQHGELHEAVRHAVLADDVPRAAAMVQRTGGWELVLFSGTVRMRALLGAIPVNRLAEFPRVQLYQAFLAAKEGDLGRGLRMFEVVATAHRGTGEPELARDLLVVGHLLGRYADEPVRHGDLETLYERFEGLPATDDAARAALLNTACLIALGLGDMRAAMDACLRASREMRRIGSVLGLNYCLLHLGLVQMQSGERREAEATWSDAASMAEENFGADSGLKAIADVHLALALHARGEIGAAAARLDDSLSKVEVSDGWLDLYAEGYETAIANALARGDTATAFDLVARMSRTADARGLARLGRLARIYDARLRGDAMPVEWQPGQWRVSPFNWREHHAAGVTQVLAALSANRPADAMTVLEDLTASAASGTRNRHARTLGVLRAAAMLEIDGPEKALPEFIRSIEDSVNEDDTQFLVDLGPAMLPLLQKAWSWSREHWPSSRGRQVLATAVTALTRASDSKGPRAIFSARELAVLVELSTGAPNKVIARHLQMNENTVKFHLKNIFQKLQVRHRAEALQAARSRGMLR